MMTKRLTRIRLINWHYFVDETIEVAGSFLVSGENTAGKSTVLDAIQLVLTTNKRKFNTAANEKSNRNLKGYVRCKTGNENSNYLRNGSVITYVALEFYEERTGKTFVIGAKIDSPDEEAKLVTKWFVVEEVLESLTFLKDDRPSTTEEFRLKGKKVNLIDRDHQARDRFARRLGNLDSRFFDIIPKSLAFKPMDNVKDFINKFILAERKIEVASLRRNIESLKELEDLMDLTRKKIEDLEKINEIYDETRIRDRQISINKILIALAQVDQLELEVEKYSKQLRMIEQAIKSAEIEENRLKISVDQERKQQMAYEVALNSHQNSALIQKAKDELTGLYYEQSNLNKSIQILEKAVKVVEEIALKLKVHNDYFIGKEELLQIVSDDVTTEQKTLIVHAIDKSIRERDQKYSDDFHDARNLQANMTKSRIALEEDIRSLKKKQMTYPSYTQKLKRAIEEEFARKGIKRPVHIFSELIEVTDVRWQNAIEGYLNTQRFNIIVEPRDYEVALETYNRIRHEVHTVGLVNTEKLKMDFEVNKNSLFYVVTSENRYAYAYAAYLLNRVIRCDHVKDLKNHRVAITDGCMIYNHYAVHKIKEEVYTMPYIGRKAIEIQLLRKQEQLEGYIADINGIKEDIRKYDLAVQSLRKFRLEDLLENIQTPEMLKNNKLDISQANLKLKEAENDPTYLELKMKQDESQHRLKELDENHKKAVERKTFKSSELGQTHIRMEEAKGKLKNEKNLLDRLGETDAGIMEEGYSKYSDQKRSKTPDIIINNFGRRIKALETEIDENNRLLQTRQVRYCKGYDADMNIGINYIQEYVDEHYKLSSSEIIKYDEELKKAKEHCHLEFRESFLAKLKEYIENAQYEFRHLNKALKDIYYGDDSYHFVITFDKKKESIYRMIMSGNNVVGDLNLWSSAFDAEFEEEMEDLFSKLTAYDDMGDKVIEEYTDYRSYLDYDIEVRNKEGYSQRFSKIYGEKSGGETQTPYYVAIAASFSQLYKLGDTVRIIMFDEAFDKMDDNRIASMMDFLIQQEFQVILATPPSKLEVIGEKVDTILMAMREGSMSIIETYDL